MKSAYELPNGKKVRGRRMCCVDVERGRTVPNLRIALRIAMALSA
jgi:DNA-binding XRE family transcriptional regulator